MSAHTPGLHRPDPRSRGGRLDSKTLGPLLKKHADKIDWRHSEDEGDDGVWVYFKPGWLSPACGTHGVNGTATECASFLRDGITECRCEDCLPIARAEGKS